MKEMMVSGFQVQTDGRTVWVNSPTAGAVGRFGRGGIDVHTAANDGCKDCGPHDPDMSSMWERFKEGMKGLHGVIVPESFRPDWTKEVADA